MIKHRRSLDPETYEVRADGVLLTSKPAERLPLTQLYNLFEKNDKKPGKPQAGGNNDSV